MARYNAKQRKEHATVHTKDGKEKFPVGDKSHAIQAERFINRAKPPLSSEQKHKVRAEEAKYGVGPLAKGKKSAAKKAAPMKKAS